MYCVAGKSLDFVASCDEVKFPFPYFDPAELYCMTVRLCGWNVFIMVFLCSLYARKFSDPLH
jgi:hypothetical protein